MTETSTFTWANPLPYDMLAPKPAMTDGNAFHDMESATRLPPHIRGEIAGRPLRIAIVASSYNFISDGVALTLNRLVDHLEKQGVDVRVFTPVSSTTVFPAPGTIVPVPSIPLPGRSEYRLAFALPHAEIKTFSPDLIHIALAPDPLGFTTLRIARKLGVPLVASYHTRYETYLKHYWYVAAFENVLKRYLSSYYANCREVYVPSQSMIDILQADGQKGKLVLWQRGVDPDQFNPGHRSMQWRANHGIDPEETVVLLVARLVREKQLGIFSATLHQLSSDGVPCRAVVVGDGPERAMLERALPQAIFTGFLRGQELSVAYASSDIFVFPSETETFGNVTLEAMASGLVCICADASGSRSLVLDGLTGFLARPGDVAEFAARVEQLIRNPALRTEMAATARARALMFSWDQTMSNLLDHYKALVRDSV
ncbi:glycosyltransferase family 4 protein [Brytella acorum]|uniref:Glycosyltransferase family 1 protein n=1 Tax=Brytella acorum TaxID=2959299 RepID=A0AA35XWV6_9PROT|nr:glycosyltransferase family 1 protein [Brytella acorum]MDF3625836.1 glycosyltransferase family 1 protein [Brytella acorum]CAI9121264.1 glycosyltransferase family 1 protein [Brytella acorum]